MREKATTALITGIGGQDGSYLAELLLQKGYRVFGIERAGSTKENLKDVTGVALSAGDVTDSHFLREQLKVVCPDEIYNLASVSTVANPWENPRKTLESTAFVPLTILEAMREFLPGSRLFQASSAEMYGEASESPQNENTPFRPCNPYGVGKTAAHNLIEAYRRDHHIFSVSGILFNHESPRRGREFVTQKIATTLARISLGKEQELRIGNLDVRRDWSHARDVVQAVWKTLQHDRAESYVIASGRAHTVREFIEIAAKRLGMDIAWKAEGQYEVGVDPSGTVRVRVASEFYRPAEMYPRRGDNAKIAEELEWEPKISFKELVEEMVEAAQRRE